MQKVSAQAEQQVAELRVVPYQCASPDWSIVRGGAQTSRSRGRILPFAFRLPAWPLDRYAIVRKDLRGLILGFAAFNEREIRSGVTELARALTKGATH